MSRLISFVLTDFSCEQHDESENYNIVAAFREMHLSPAKHIYA